MWGLVFFAPLFYAPGVFFCSFFSASSFDWHGADYALAVVHTLVLVGMSVSVCRDASLQFHAELWELMVMVGDPVVDACEPVARREYWITRVATEIVFRSLRSDKDALLDQPCCQGDCIPAFAIRHGRSLCEERAVQLFSVWWHEGRLSLEFRDP